MGYLLVKINGLTMNQKKLNSLIANTHEAKQFLKSEISTRLKTQSYRDLEKITGLNSKQIQRINDGNYPHFESVLKACQGLLNNTNKPTKPKKRRE